MADHKFKPFEKVMVRTFHGKWKCEIFSHYDYKEKKPFECAGGKYRECIPYTPETAHLLGTSQSYEPPVEYEWGQKVEVWSFANKWEQSVFVGRRADGKFMYILKFDEIVRIVDDISKIRPLTDTAAH